MPFTKKTAGKTVKKTVPAKKIIKKRAPAKQIRFKVTNSDTFKAGFIQISMKFGKDGILSGYTAKRFKGRPDTDSVKTVDLAEHDPETFAKAGLRLAAGCYINSPAKRFPAFSAAMAMIRVGKRGADDSVLVAFKFIKFKPKDGKVKTLDKSDPFYRAIRKSAKFLPGAFTNFLPFPSAAELKAMEKAKLAAEQGDEDESETETEAPAKKRVAKKVAKKVPAKKVAKKKARG